ncbi:hypothetical protein PR003_g27150 [Phytophthora rubi]|uniref:Helitron helicase-like domain-containing protein n=1 Tax=Phytophthora rubi TaxID=129364 RepID=A0A6A4C3H5_9STRA|nr:hypothetical protein PR003_g27150 [Phytophthora rubi]
MAPKRKRTRREIEEALLQNARVNATPAGPEDASDRKKRRKRRNYHKRNLDKEFSALNIDAADADVPTANVREVVTTEGATVEQEGKQEDDDPAAHQRRYAAADVEGQRTTESEAVSTATPILGLHDRAAALRARDAERARVRRANMSASQKERTKAKNKERARASRARRTEEQRIAIREIERLRKQQRRARQTPAERETRREHNRIQQQVRRAAQTDAERRDVQQQNRVREAARRADQTDTERETIRQVNRERDAASRAAQTDEQRAASQVFDRERHASLRASQTEGERAASRALDRERHAIVRALQTEEERSATQAVHREQHATRRAALTEGEVEARREQERIRRKSVKRCHGHVNHENFRASMVTGENVVNGRHRLPPTVVCPLCQAWKWPDESDFMCCMKGRVRLHPLQPAPGRLLELYGDSEFRRHVRAYNQAFAFTSIGASSSDSTFRAVDQDQDVAGQHGVYSYRIQGAMGHYLGSMLPYVDPATGERTSPKFAQIYIVDPDMQARAQRRKGIYADLDNVALKDIEDMMERCNPFAQQFLNFGEKLREDLANGVDVMDIQYRLHAKPSQDHQLLRLFETDEKYDPLQYPLLFPHGDLGWTHTLTYADGAVYRNKRKMALREHTAYRLFQKVGDQSALHQGGRLFQQWVVDQRAKCEQEQLRWVATHQKEIRANQYHGVEDALLNENTINLDEGEGLLSEYDRTRGELVHPDRQQREDHFLRQIGKRVILPDSHVGGPRFMYKAYQDSMAIVREYGKPNDFVTMTCNPKWEEIEEKIADPLQSAQDRPDIVARVWQQKLKALLKDLDEGVLGRLLARIYVVEFQKRGLPHAHILIILEDEDKPRTREIIDKLVSTELPDKNVNPDFFDTVMTCMMHGQASLKVGVPAFPIK